MTVIIDPGHGMSNKKRGVYDPGAVSNGVTEAEIVMEWANELRSILKDKGHKVVRTRVDDKDDAQISQRSKIAKHYKGDIMLSLHCNAYNTLVSGTETFYRGSSNKDKARRINDAVCTILGSNNRGIKLESQSQHKTLSVMNFQPCFLLEIGFIDHFRDREKMLDCCLRKKACEAIAEILLSE